MLTTCFFENFEVCIFIFGHFINVQFSKQPINNVPVPNNSNTYWFSYLKNDIAAKFVYVSDKSYLLILYNV